MLRLTEMGDSATIHHVFELILRLKQICNFDPATGESSKLERLAADLEEVAASGQKAIIFSQWVDTIKRLSKRTEAFESAGISRPGHNAAARQNHRTVSQRSATSRHADDLRRRRRGAESAIQQLRVSVRSLVEPGR